MPRSFSTAPRPSIPTLPTPLLVTRRLAIALLLLVGSGCGGSEDGGNRSSLASDAPAAYERATTEAEQVRQEAKRAEAAAAGRVLGDLDQP